MRDALSLLADGPGTRIPIRVVPGARSDALAGLHGHRLRVRVAAPPEDGKANRAACRLLAQCLGCKSRDVEVVSGHTARDKIVLVGALSPDQVMTALLPLLDSGDA